MQSPASFLGKAASPANWKQSPHSPRRRLASVVALAGMAASLLGCGGAARAYTSPFSLTVTAPASWFSDFQARNGLITSFSTPRPVDWYNTVYPNPSWGPLNPQLFSVTQAQIGDPAWVKALQFDRGEPVYSAPLNSLPAGTPYLDWATQRVMAAAQSLIGTPYQHLHLPQFDPGAVLFPGSFSWLPVSNQANLQSSQQLLQNLPGTQLNPYKTAYGLAAAGIDCTDFTAYVYNLALGYQLHSGTNNQVAFPQGGGFVGGAASATVVDSSGLAVQPTFFYGPNYGKDAINPAGGLDDLIPQLQPGDLLYIGNRQQILHVVMWLGALGVNADGSPSTVPLVISSHDNTPAIFDTQDISFAAGDDYGFPVDGLIEEHLPPPGVHILPFTAENWFYQDFQLAMRVLPSQSPASVPAPSLPFWAVVLVARRLRGLRRRVRGLGSGAADPSQTAR